MTIELRPYQEAAEAPLRAALRQHRRVAVCAPTGAGKGVVIAWMAAGASAKGHRVMIVVHRRELVAQAVAALGQAGIAAGVVAAGHAEVPELAVQVAMVGTLVRPQRLARWAEWNPDLLIVDESHHLLARSWAQLIEVYPRAWTIGFTATPLRLDGKGLGRIFGDMVTVATVKELIAGGYLSPVRHFAPTVTPDLSGARVRGGDFVAEDAVAAMRQAAYVGDPVEHYRRHLNGAPAIGYAVNRPHSEELAATFRAAGWRAAHVDAQTPIARREAAIAALERGELNLLFNVGLFSEGLDVPVLGGVLLLRPTLSLGLYLQMVGRALRPAPGKEFAVILDHAGNALRHGLADDDQEWTLADRPRRKNGLQAPVKRCSYCSAMAPVSARVCPVCGVVFSSAPAAPEMMAGELRIADAAAIQRQRVAGMSWRAAVRWAGRDAERLKLVAEVRGYRRGWVEHQRERALEVV